MKDRLDLLGRDQMRLEGRKDSRYMQRHIGGKCKELEARQVVLQNGMKRRKRTK